MYSKNDYRYYLENQLAHSNDFLAHYGVKGMKWKQHLKNKYVSIGSKKYDNGKKSIDLYTGPSKKERSIKKGRVSIDTGSEGSHISIDTTKKKKSKKNKLSSIRKKYGLYREKPKGKKLKGGGNIYVSHS